MLSTPITPIPTPSAVVPPDFPSLSTLNSNVEAEDGRAYCWAVEHAKVAKGSCHVDVPAVASFESFGIDKDLEV